MNVFLDTSAFSKRYVAERGSDRVQTVCAEADRLLVSIVCLPEFVSTLCRLVREKRLSAEHYQRLQVDAIGDLGDADVCQITAEVLSSAVSLLESNPLRAMDALQLASALVAAPDAFVSADQRQIEAARRSGLNTVDVA